MPAQNRIQGYLHLNRLKGQICHSKLNKMVSSVKCLELIGQMGVRWTLESTVSSWKVLESHLSDKSVWMVGSRVYCSWIWDGDPFSSPLLLQIKTKCSRLAGQTGATYSLKMLDESFGTFRKGFQHPTPTSPPSSTNSTLFLIIHYPIPVLGHEFQAAWMHVNLRLTGTL